MDHLLLLLVVATLIGLVVCYIRLIIRKVRAASLRSGLYSSHPRHRRGSLSIALVGLALAVLVALATPIDLVRAAPIPPDADTVTTVSCELNDFDPALVAHVIKSRNSSLFDQLAATCHKLPDGRLSKPCELLPPIDSNTRDTPALPACFTRTPAVDFFVYDPLADDQTEEWTLVSLARNELDTIHIHRAKRAELLVIAIPEAGSYNYSLETDSYSDKSWCPAHQPMIGEGKITVRKGSFFVVSGTSCRGNRVWLADWTPVN